MKKIKKNSIKKKTVKKSSIRKKPFKKSSIRKKTSKKNSIKKKTVKKSSIRKKTSKKNSIKKKTVKKSSIKKRASLISKIIKFQYSLKPKFNFKINFSLEKYIQAFFDIFANRILEYKILKAEEKRNKKLEDIEKKEKEKILIYKQKIKEEELQTKIQEKNLKEEVKLEKERARDIKLFLRKEQALLRIEQAERQKQFLKQLQLEKQIEKFRIREIKELEKIEKISLKEKRDDYAGLQARIEKLKDKYRIIRDQKIRERVEALGVKITGNEDRETLIQKEKDYKIARQKIELSLESFYRSASSLVFQLNKRHVTRHMSIFRCIDQRFETGEIFIKWDEASDEEWLLLIYIKDNSPDKGIVIEDKSNPEKNSSYEFKPNEIFKASDLMVDSLTQLISRKRGKKD
ncbi:hypothetical protein ABXT63_06045 [Candidatus Pelagibacter sp. Uisw_092]|uniref:hypothetical protein n=1 Tax=Candidatus Pelagibacter sp. Uisw_092 TaxID=3230979 RepID=UPI0039EA37CD